MEFLYILFTKTGSEAYTKELLVKNLDKNKFNPFLITNDYFYKRNNEVMIKNKILFPGYIFIKSSLSDKDFFASTKDIFEYFTDIYYILNYGSNSQLSVKENEKSLLFKLCDEQFKILPSIGYIEDNQIYIEKGALMGKESLIKKINRHKRIALIEFGLMGINNQVKVSLEISRKI